MKPTVRKSLLFLILSCSGCDNPNTIPTGSGGNGYDYLSYLQTMNKVHVTYIGETLHHTFVKQGSRDSGNTSDLWLVRRHAFENTDSTYFLVWKDSEFSTQACFSLELFDPSYFIAGGCSKQSLIRGVYHSSARSITDLICQFQECEGCQDPNNYRTQNAYLKAPNFELDAFYNDSVSFKIKNWNPGALAIGYNDDEVSYSTYITQIQLAGFDTLGKDYPPICRVVFSK